jgi:GT2 family glycosyltransferase
MKYDLTIVIATLGFDSLYNTINSILRNKQDKNVEILVIGKLPNNRLNKYLQEHSFIKYYPVSFKQGDLSKKRNLGFEKASSEIVAFVDDDTVLLKDWFNKALKYFDDKNMGIVSGPGRIPKKAGFLIELFGNTLSSIGGGPIRTRYKPGKKIIEDTCGDKIIGCNMVIRKAVYEKIGGFDPKIIPAEELDFASRTIKNGFRVIQDPDFFLIHHARSNPFKFFKQVFRFGRSKINTIKKRIQPLKTPYLLPLMVLLLFPIFFILGFFIREFFYLLGVGFILYFIFVLIAVLDSIMQTKNPLNVLLFITIPYMHTAYGVGELYGFFID